MTPVNQRWSTLHFTRLFRVQNLASFSLKSNFSVSFRPQVNLTQIKDRAETIAYPRNTFVCWSLLYVRRYVTAFHRYLALLHLPVLEIRGSAIVVMKFEEMRRKSNSSLWIMLTRIQYRFWLNAMHDTQICILLFLHSSRNLTF